MTIRDSYTRWSETYDKDPNRTRDLDHDVTRQRLAALRVSHVVEIGCGTGKNTALLADVGEAVLALDFSEGMLAQARAKVNRENVTFAQADLAQPWPCASGSADLVVCNLVLEHIEDLAFIFGEAARVLRPSGKFFVCELHPFCQYAGTQANFSRGAETTAIPAFVHHLSDFTRAGEQARLRLTQFDEWWHKTDAPAGRPRLASFLFEKAIHCQKWAKEKRGYDTNFQRS